MKTIQKKNQMIWFDEKLLSPNEADYAFDINYWQQQKKVVGSAQGRGTTWFIQLDALQAALRHYRRGGLFGKLISDRYLFHGWRKTRCFQEWHLLALMREQGIRVPRPIAARAIKSGISYRADLLSEKVPNARDLVSILEERPLDAAVYRKIGDEIRKMHHAQVNHTDLNIHNILLDNNEQVWLIDFDKCYQQSGDAWKQDNWDRLKRSFEKEQKKRQIHWTADEFKLLLSGG
ncbi:3-deoxy-D-manno-octulosonic acid kinase [Vibrio nereis]|uniref:3-deoxy-D-manno-octulosonic acid kinase n=1 Tax=Vibrio nereis TaxID=693 RepID=A0A0M0HM85_VIBNE|nr:3-deoxy-D-manno-octulosonic acid kinase [Vibrio nereis]KOO02897.1 3-deoxy-D-manno-octulosonic acid kinase [Vibrio nereis]